MSSIKFLEPSGSNLITEDMPNTGITNLTVSRDTAPWIYSNYPEGIGSFGNGLALADNGYYINQQRIKKGDAEIFYSHRNDTGKTLKFRIHIYNCSATTVTVNCTNIGFSSEWELPETAVKDFFTKKGNSLILKSGESGWLTPEYEITTITAAGKMGTRFTGMIRLNTSNDIIVTEYAYPFDTDSFVITGVGIGNFITFNHVQQSSEKTKVSALAQKPYIYAVNSYNPGQINVNELVPIHILGTNITANAYNTGTNHKNYDDLGNWCAHNYHIIKFTNDTSKVMDILVLIQRQVILK